MSVASCTDSYAVTTTMLCSVKGRRSVSGTCHSYHGTLEAPDFSDFTCQCRRRRRLWEEGPAGGDPAADDALVSRMRVCLIALTLNSLGEKEATTTKDVGFVMS